MLSIACVDQFLVAKGLISNKVFLLLIPISLYGVMVPLFSYGIRRFFHSLFILNFFYYNIILNQTDMYISKRFSSEVKSTKVTQKMDKIVSVTNKNIYRESLLTSSKLENFIKIKYFVFLFNEYQADGLNYTRNPGFKEKRYGLDCIEDSMEANYCESIPIQILSNQILQFIVFRDLLIFKKWINRTRIKRDKRKIRRLYKVDIIKTTPSPFPNFEWNTLLIF
ncbi:hypothetical protein ACJX0J_002562 [Zea mays]